MDSYTEYTNQKDLKKPVKQLLSDFYLTEVQKLETLDWSLLNAYTSNDPCEEDHIFAVDLLVFFVGTFSETEEEIKEILAEWPKSYTKLKNSIHKLKGASAYTVAARFRACLLLIDELILRSDFIVLPRQDVEDCLCVLLREMHRLRGVVSELKVS